VVSAASVSGRRSAYAPTVTTWREAERVALTLPEAERGEAHEGSPAVWVRNKQFARLRWDGDRELLQVWVADPALVPTYVEEDAVTYRAIPGYSRHVVLAALDRLNLACARELVVESWAARAPMRLVTARGPPLNRPRVGVSR
jgi:hypothetical protein